MRSIIPLAGVPLLQRQLGDFRMTNRKLPPGLRLTRHCHDTSVVTVVTYGGFQERLHNRLEECRPGAVRFLPAGEPHANYIDNPAACLQFELSPALIAKFEEMNMRTESLGGEIKSAEAKRIARALQREARLVDGVTNLSIEALLTALLGEAAQLREASLASRPYWLKKAMELLEASLVTPPSLGELAAEVDVHPVHLCREFHRYHRCTIGTMIRRLRIEQACHLLAGHSSLTEIALECGFNDQSHFCNSFKKATGYTPAYFRKQLKSSTSESRLGWTLGRIR